MSNQDFIFKLIKHIDTQIKELLIDFLDLYQVVNYNEENGNLTVRRLHEKVNDIEEIIDGGKGYGDGKQVSMGYEPGDILIIMDLKGTKIVLGSIFNEFFEFKDKRIVPKKGEFVLNCKSFKLLNREGYGIIMNELGEMTVHASKVNFTQTPYTIEYKE
jgi:hypothetical protein